MLTALLLGATLTTDRVQNIRVQAPIIPFPQENRILVDLETQTLTAFEDETPKFKFKCSTGRNNGTPAGEFPIRQKLRYNNALPKFGGMAIPFSLRLDVVTRGKRRLIAIHAHPSVPRYPASHGCIRLKPNDAQKLFAWAKVGTRVVID